MNILQVDLARMLRDTGAFPFDRWSDDAGDIIYTIEGLAAIIAEFVMDRAAEQGVIIK